MKKLVRCEELTSGGRDEEYMKAINEVMRKKEMLVCVSG